MESLIQEEAKDEGLSLDTGVLSGSIQDRNTLDIGPDQGREI